MNVISAAFRLAVRGLWRRVRQQWPVWVSLTGGVALVGIASGLAGSVDQDLVTAGVDPQALAAALTWCATGVAVAQGMIMASRLLQNDRPFVRTLFSFGLTPLEIAGVRGLELLLGFAATVIVGLFLALLALEFVFQLPFEGGGILRTVAIGFVPALVIPVLSISVRPDGGP